MKNHIIVLERKCWSNEQYSRRECLEISGIPSDTEAGKLEETLLKVFEKLDVDVDLENMEDCHWLKTRNNSKKVIVKLSKRKDADKICQVKKKIEIVEFGVDGHKQSNFYIVCVPTIKSSGPNVKSVAQ